MVMRCSTEARRRPEISLPDLGQRLQQPGARRADADLGLGEAGLHHGAVADRALRAARDLGPRGVDEARRARRGRCPAPRRRSPPRSRSSPTCGRAARARGARSPDWRSRGVNEWSCAHEMIGERELVATPCRAGRRRSRCRSRSPRSARTSMVRSTGRPSSPSLAACRRPGTSGSARRARSRAGSPRRTPRRRSPCSRRSTCSTALTFGPGPQASTARGSSPKISCATGRSR